MTQGTPPSVIHGWKATDLCYAMVKTKNYFLNPISRQNFAYAFAVTHNLEVCLMQNVGLKKIGSDPPSLGQNPNFDRE